MPSADQTNSESLTPQHIETKENSLDSAKSFFDLHTEMLREHLDRFSGEVSLTDSQIKALPGLTEQIAAMETGLGVEALAFAEEITNFKLDQELSWDSRALQTLSDPDAMHIAAAAILRWRELSILVDEIMTSEQEKRRETSEILPPPPELIMAGDKVMQLRRLIYELPRAHVSQSAERIGVPKETIKHLLR